MQGVLPYCQTSRVSGFFLRTDKVPYRGMRHPILREAPRTDSELFAAQLLLLQQGLEVQRQPPDSWAVSYNAKPMGKQQQQQPQQQQQQLGCMMQWLRLFFLFLLRQRPFDLPFSLAVCAAVLTGEW